MTKTTAVELLMVTIRLRRTDVVEAKRIAREQGVPYSYIIRQWLADKGEQSRRDRLKAKI